MDAIQGKLEDAERWLRVAMQEAVEGFGDDTPHVAAAMNNLAECLRLQGRFSEAEPMYLRGLELLERAFGKEDPRVGQAHHNLVGYYINTKQVAKAQVRALMLLPPLPMGTLDPPQGHPAMGPFAACASTDELPLHVYCRHQARADRALKIFLASLGKNHPQVLR